MLQVFWVHVPLHSFNFSALWMFSLDDLELMKQSHYQMVLSDHHPRKRMNQMPCWKGFLCIFYIFNYSEKGIFSASLHGVSSERPGRRKQFLCIADVVYLACISHLKQIRPIFSHFLTTECFGVEFSWPYLVEETIVNGT